MICTNVCRVKGNYAMKVQRIVMCDVKAPNE